VSDSLDAEPEYRQTSVVDILLPPTTSIQQGLALQPVNVQLSGCDLIAIHRGERILYVYGFVEYLDMSETLRRTHFCWRYHVQAGFNSIPTGFHIMADIPAPYLRCTSNAG
jgi:hypothetical protein